MSVPTWYVGKLRIIIHFSVILALGKLTQKNLEFEVSLVTETLSPPKKTETNKTQ